MYFLLISYNSLRSPQYPIYSALISKLGGRQVGYSLDESLNWSVTREELESKLAAAKADGLEVKALAMINPGNPSGNVMTHCDIQTVVEFCAVHGIVLMADEVYQANVYNESAQFVSAKKVALDMLAQCSDDDLANKIVTAPWDPTELVLGHRLLQMVNHLNQHKGQLYYYLKLQGKPVNTGNLWGM